MRDDGKNIIGESIGIGIGSISSFNRSKDSNDPPFWGYIENWKQNTQTMCIYVNDFRWNLDDFYPHPLTLRGEKIYMSYVPI